MEDDGGPVWQGPVVAAMEGEPAVGLRDSILDAVVVVVGEHGVSDASVELVLARAGVSRRAFYACFEDLDECLVAILDGALERAAPLIAQAFAREGSWWDGMRAAFAQMLVFFESEPELARVCMVEARAGGPVVREHRERIFEVFRGLVVEREIERGNELARESLAGRGEEGQPRSGRPGRSSGVVRGRGECPSVAVRSHVVALDPEPGAISIEDARAGVVERLRARREELVQALFARVRAGALAGSGDDDAEYVAGLRATVAAAVDYVLEGIERGETDGSPPPPPIPVVAAEQARRAARVGVPLETVLRRYLVGHTLFERFVMDEAAGSRSADEGEAVRGALRAQAAVLDRLLERIAREYGDELQQMGRSPERRRSERVRRLLEGGVAEDGAVAEAGLDYELEDRWHLGVIATGTDAARAVRGLAVSADRRLLSVSQGERSVWAWLGGRQRFAAGEIERVIGIGFHPPVDGMGSHPVGSHPPAVLVFGEPARGFEGWRLTHQQAQAALVVALRRNGIPRNGIPRNEIPRLGSPRIGSPPTPGGVTRYADVALLASALKDPALAKALLDIYIAPLEDAQNRGQALFQTLRAYLAAECNVSSAAIKLGVARSTVKDRMRTIEERLGRTLNRCPPELQVALELDELVPATHPPGIPIAGKSVT